MEYFFKPGDRIEISSTVDIWGFQTGSVVDEFLSTTGPCVRVKLDKWPRPLTFRKDLVNPIGDPAGQDPKNNLSEKP